MQKRILSLFFVFICLIFNFINVYAISNAETTRLFKKVKTNSEFVTTLSKVLPLYAELDVTEKLLDENIKKLIATVMDNAILKKEAGELSEENLGVTLKEVVMDSVMTMDPVYISMMIDAYPAESITMLQNGRIPPELQGLCVILTDEAKYTLGYKQRENDVVFDDMLYYEWANPAVNYLFDLDIVSGMTDFTYAPGNDVTREQFVKLLCETFKIPSLPYTTQFKDVDAQAWYYPYLQRMEANGFIAGISSDTFGIGNSITRQDMAVLMYRIGKQMGVIQDLTPTNDFKDRKNISEYALFAVEALQVVGIVNGDENFCFNPKKTATRAEAAQMVYNLLNYVEKNN